MNLHLLQRPGLFVAGGLLVPCVLALMVLAAVEYPNWRAATDRYVAQQAPAVQANCEAARAALKKEVDVQCAEETRSLHQPGGGNVYLVLMCEEKVAAQLGISMQGCNAWNPGSFLDYLAEKSDSYGKDLITGVLAGWAALMFGYAGLRLLLAERHLGWRRLAILVAAGSAIGLALLAWSAGWNALGVAAGALAGALVGPVLLLGCRRLVGWVREGFALSRPAGSPPTARPPVAPLAEEARVDQVIDAATAAADPSPPSQEASSSRLPQIGAAVGAATLVILGLVLTSGRSYELLVSSLVQVAVLVPAVWGLKKLLDWWHRRR